MVVNMNRLLFVLVENVNSSEDAMAGRKEDYLPTENEILEGCREVQKTWTEEQEQKRSVFKIQRFNIKVISPIEEKDNV